MKVRVDLRGSGVVWSVTEQRLINGQAHSITTWVHAGVEGPPPAVNGKITEALCEALFRLYKHLPARDD